MQVLAPYRAGPVVTRMVTGYWWNGYEYHKSEREARRQAWLLSRRRDPQFRRDALFVLVASVTVLPAAAAPWLAAAGTVYLAATPGPRGWPALLAVAGLVSAPFAWRVIGPIAPRLLGPGRDAPLRRRLEELEAIRADLTQAQAAELERIERDLHDGAQARMVALGLSLAAAERLVRSDPERAVDILREARTSSAEALTELRLLVRGINPPVLAERGLVDAVRALALDAPVEVIVCATVPSRPERPVESAVYFAVAELLANVAKHSHATRATVELAYQAGAFCATVTDDGVGGAIASEGSGLDGIRRRVAAFGGHVDIESPPSGPTRVNVTVPCGLS